MPVESLTYAELGSRWSVTPEAARKRVRGLRLATSVGNDGKARVAIDLEDLAPRPQGRPAGPPPAIAAMTVRIAGLEAELADARSQLERERQRVDTLIASLGAHVQSRPTRTGLVERIRQALLRASSS